MNILYHHRTQAEDAQGIHIKEIIKGFRLDGHTVLEAALVRTDDKITTQDDSTTEPPPSFLSKLKDNLPSFARELLEISYSLFGFIKLMKDSKNFNADFIYERYALYNAAGIFYSKWKNIPIIIEVNSPLVLEQNNLGQLSFTHLAVFLEKWILNKADHLICVSTPLKNILTKQGINNKSITVLPNGVDPDHFHGNSAAGDPIRKKYNLQNKKVIGFVGWIRKWHGIEEIVKSMATWGDELSDTHLLIVGDGPARQDIEKTALKLNLSHRVHITGAIKHSNIVPYLAAIDIALQPAATPYASPMKILEYLAMGKPIISIRQENTEELLNENINALFFNPDNNAEFIEKLELLLADDIKLNKMSSAARESIFIHKYLWTENAKNTLKLLSLKSKE